MAAASPLIRIQYGSFDTNATGVNYHGAHSLRMDEREFVISFDVVLTTADAADMAALVSSIDGYLNLRHQDFTMTSGGTVLYKFVDGVDGTGADEEGAEFIQASWRLLASHRTVRSRAYRVTIKVTRAAKQPGKLGVYEQSIRLSKSVLGPRRLSFRAQFTPGATQSQSGTAEDSFADATYGFDALVTALQTALGGTWEKSSSLTKAYDEDARTLTASQTFSELIYAQSGDATNDDKLSGVRYDVRVEKKSCTVMPGTLGTPLTAVTVLFSSGVDADVTQDLDSVIQDVIVPYCRNTVVSTLQLTGGAASAIWMGHGLRADPVNNRVAGQLFFLVKEGTTVLQSSLQWQESGRPGETRVPVLDGTEWRRDIHTGPGLWTRRATLFARVLGPNPDSVLDPVELKVHLDMKQAGFRLAMWDVNTESSDELHSEGAGGRITTTVQRRVLVFERCDVRVAANGVVNDGNAQGQFLSSRVNPDFNVAGFRQRYPDRG